jgi:hypothetical protein
MRSVVARAQKVSARVAEPLSASLTVRRWFDQSVSIVLSKPGVGGLSETVRALREWQYDGAPMQLHPGDLGWHWRFGAEATAAAVRTWGRDGRILAVGLLDSPKLLRLAIAPDAEHDGELAQQMVADVTQPGRGVLSQGSVYIEARFGALFQGLLFDDGWSADEPWTPLSRDLTEPVEDCGVRIEVIGPEQAHVRAAVQRAAFDRSTFTDERWRAMAAGSPYADACCLVGYDDQGNAAAALRELGSSSAIVCAESSNIGAVATYRSAGFRQLPEVRDLQRSA